MSTLSKRKGVKEFLEAYVSLEKNLRDKLNLFFLGEGELLNELMQIKKDNKLINVHFLGHVNQEVVRDFLSFSDIFALPTKLDPNPLTPIEASYMRKPLLISKFAGNYNELLNGNTGLSIDTISPEAIKKSLLELTTLSKKQLKEMGENSYLNVVSKFSRKSSSINLIKFLKNI